MTNFFFNFIFPALLHHHYMPKEVREQNEILEILTRYCGKSVYNYTENETDPLKWDFYNSFYFAYTVVSTIGKCPISSVQHSTILRKKYYLRVIYLDNFYTYLLYYTYNVKSTLLPLLTGDTCNCVITSQCGID